ncbi:Kap104p Ecym_5255 [Eremothecium cymbalariae DBVPG|uniref:Importin N-terminal domain-containing protein n=1 Tax=Eremothecium cymbalariae (strain CBS 270.75 / DBVPG 7215 / KCTC 17166 / NRRL Y-17582) TaxID=931890 RepID=I6ND79_ERECY|nr:hypothetical protein Ecym_5255 [Eremothecium cymbalariae DBVPG\
MNSNWVLNESTLLQLTSVLIRSMSSLAHERCEAMETLESFKLQVEFINNLCFLLVEGMENPLLKSNFSSRDLQNVSATSGMLLKNTIIQQTSGKFGYELAYFKANIFRGLCSTSSLISNISGIAVASMFSYYSRQHRDDVVGLETLSKLLEMTFQGNLASIKAMSKIMEDNAQFFQLTWAGTDNLLEFLVDCFMQIITESGDPEIRAEAIKCINSVIPLNAQCFLVKIYSFLDCLFQLATTNSNDLVRKQVCIAFSNILECRPDTLVPHMQGILQFALHLIDTCNEEDVALDACEFLFSFSTNSNIPEHMLKPYISAIIPVLLRKMVYNEDSIATFELNNGDDADFEDKDEDIKPVSAKIRKGSDNEEDEEGEDYGDDSFMDNSGTGSDWNLRKCSAATLDSLANLFPHEVVVVAFPLLRESLTSEHWFIREACILALGAIVEGGIQYFDNHLPALIPFLVEQLRDEWAAVRKITCWTLSRFSTWILNDHTEFLVPVLEPILNTLLDRKKEVQQSAITAVAVFIENSDSELIEAILYTELLNTFSRCFQHYKKKNLIVLYDAIGRLSEKVELEDSAIQLLLPPLISKWTSLSDNDKELWPLLECLSYVSASLGERFMPMAPDVYNRAFRILVHCVDMETKSHSDPTIQVPEKDFTITSLDLIDGLVQGLGQKSQEILFPNNDVTILQLMLQCLNDPNHDVRQSTFALLGDITMCYDTKLLQSAIADLLKSIISELSYSDDSDAVSSVNNAVWSLGLIAERLDIGEYIFDISRAVLDLFTTNTTIVHRSIMENLVVTIGRLAHYHPEQFVSGLFASPAIITRCCQIAKDLDDPDEKSSSYYGLIKICNIMDSNKYLPIKAIKYFVQGLAVNLPREHISHWQEDLNALFLRHQTQISQLAHRFTNDEAAIISFVMN